MSDEPKSSNVLSIKSRRPLEEVIKQEAEVASAIEKEDAEGHVKAASDFLKFVEAGRLRGIIMLGKDVQSGLFYTDMIFPRNSSTSGCTPQEALMYVGLLETLKLEFADLASMAPCLMPDGTILDPMEEPDVMDEGDYE